MKKTILLAIIFIMLGSICGSYLHKQSLTTIPTFKKNDLYYFLQEGVYTSKENMQENIKNLPSKLIVFEDDKYYVYVAISKDKDIIDKIQQIYEKEGYQTYIKSVSINNEEFSNNVTQFDLLVSESNSTEDILTIEEVVLANYEEIIGTGM